MAWLAPAALLPSPAATLPSEAPTATPHLVRDSSTAYPARRLGWPPNPEAEAAHQRRRQRWVPTPGACWQRLARVYGSRWHAQSRPEYRRWFATMWPQNAGSTPGPSTSVWREQCERALRTCRAPPRTCRAGQRGQPTDITDLTFNFRRGAHAIPMDIFIPHHTFRRVTINEHGIGHPVLAIVWYFRLDSTGVEYIAISARGPVDHKRPSPLLRDREREREGERGREGEGGREQVAGGTTAVGAPPHKCASSQPSPRASLSQSTSSTCCARRSRASRTPVPGGATA